VPNNTSDNPPVKRPQKAVAGAVSIAIISGAAGVLGAGVGGIATYKAAEYSTTQEATNARRDERKQFYADYLLATNEMKSGLAGLQNDLDSPPPDLTEFAKRNLPLVQAQEKLERARTGIDLTGPRNLINITDEINSKSSRTVSDGMMAIALGSQPGDHRDEIKALKKKYDSGVTDLYGLFRAFEDAARNDLGIE
jgi:hypothetical protein